MQARHSGGSESQEREPRVRILIAEGHTLFREGLRELLDEQPDFHVVGEATDGRETLRLVEDLKPDVLVLDLEMAELPGLDVLKRLGGAVEQTRTILLIAAVEKDQVSEAFGLGARGLTLKDVATDSLLACIRSVMAGKYWILGKPVSDLKLLAREQGKDVKANARSNKYGLTRRELEILASIIAGETNRQIAEKLSISEQTVKHHLTHIFDKAGVYNRLELALFAIHHGLVGRKQETSRTH